MITPPNDITVVHKKSTSRVFDGFIKDIMITMGAQSTTVEKLYHEPNKHEMTVDELNQKQSISSG